MILLLNDASSEYRISLFSQLVVHQIVPNLSLVPLAVQPPQLLPDVLLVPRMRELEQPALLLTLDYVACQFDRHLLRGDDESPSHDALLDISLQIVLQFQLIYLI